MKRIIALVIVVLLITFAWTGAWLFVSNQLSRQVALLAKASDLTLPAISCARFSVSGFPFRFDATCKDVLIVSGDAEYRLPEIKATVLAYRPTHVIGFFTGPLTYSNAFFGSQQRLDWTQLQASVRLGGWGLARASIVASDLSLFDVLIGEDLLVATPNLQAHVVKMLAAPGDEAGLAALAISARAEQISAPALSITEGEIVLDAEIDRVPDDVRRWIVPGLARRWQAAVGQLKIIQFSASTKDTQTQLSGHVTLTETGAVEGELQVNSKGLADRFAAALSADMQTLMFGSRDADGGYTQELSIVDGVVLAGGVPVARLDPAF